MIRRLILINVALLAILCFLGYKLRERILLARKHEAAILAMRVVPPSVPVPAPLGKVAPLDATAYQDVVTKNLFARDRNPQPIPDPPPAPPPPPPVPAFPVARGVMLWGGVPPTIVLSSSKTSNDQRGYHPGEKIGEWKIVSVDNQYVVLEWNGKEFKKRLDELMDRNPIAPEAPAQVAASAPAAPVTQKLAEAKEGFGADMGGGYRACAPGDTQPAGTVVDGMKKVVSSTPFNPNVCRWEPVSQ